MNWKMLKRELLQEWNADQAAKTARKATAQANVPSAKSGKVCDNCKKAGRKRHRGHTKADCFWPGGGKEDSAPDWVKEKLKETETPTIGKNFMAKTFNRRLPETCRSSI